MPGYPTDRVIVYNRDAAFAFELTPDEQQSRMRIEEINGEHSLTIQTTRKLAEGMRLITQDDTGKVREHVVYKSDEGHNKGKYAIGTYLCMWSLQYDLMSSYAHEHAEPGMGSSCSSRNAVIAALDGQSLWTVGTCDVPAVAAGKGCVMIGVSDWERLSLVVKHWGGEVDSEIVMDDTRVVSRKVNFLAHLGSSTVTRRFDWGEDLTNISRTPDPGPYYCRIVPLGRGQREYAEDDETEFDWPIDITEETGGIEYIEDGESALVFRTKLPDGSWHYPTKVVKYDEDDPELLLNAGNADLHNHTRPGCSYEANVLQFARAGMDAKGVQLGDNTQCVDFGFNPDAGLTVEGRVTRLEVEELAPETKTILTIGDLAPTFAQTMQELIGRQTTSISDGIKRVEGGGTIVYLQHLLDEINAEINGTGGYNYLVPGEGIITYDRRVADPLIGTEATQVTQIKGGNIRIANTKKPSFSGINDWEWKTVIVSGHIAAELVTAAHIMAGYIGNSSGSSYMYLDNGELYLSSGNKVTDAEKVATNYLTFNTSAGLDVGYSGTSAKTRVNGSGVEIFDGNGDSALFAGINGSNSIVRVGKASGSGNVVMSSEGYVDVHNGSTVMAHFGYGNGKNSSGGTSIAPYYDIGIRESGTTVGNYSIVEGYDCRATGYCSHAEGSGCQATAREAHAEGMLCKVSGDHSHAGGSNCRVEGDQSFAHGSSCYVWGDSAAAFGFGTRASSHSFALGSCNIGYDNSLIEVGNGLISSPKNVMNLWSSGSLWISGSYSNSSDRRLKTHHAYLAEDAVDFVRQLKPALFTKDGERHVGFYAQDVQAAEPEEWDTVTVTSQHTDESLDFDPLTLDYNALIAPLVAYAQQLEKRIDQQQQAIEILTKRLGALEGR